MHRGKTVLIFLLARAFGSAGTAASDAKMHEEQIIRAIDKAQQDRDVRLAGYSVSEQYTIRNSRLKTPAETTVATTFTKGDGKVYGVIARSGPPVLQTRVLDRLLNEEAEMSRGEQHKNAVLTSSNYHMRLIGQESVNGRECYVVELTPRRKSTHLLKGRAWVDAENHSLVRIEGKPTASVSFLVGRPEIVRDYAQIDGFALAQRSRATSESFLLGRTELIIEYTGYRISCSETK
jgi:negative regulator of sigma E activity